MRQTFEQGLEALLSVCQMAGPSQVYEQDTRSPSGRVGGTTAVGSLSFCVQPLTDGMG